MNLSNFSNLGLAPKTWVPARKTTFLSVRLVGLALVIGGLMASFTSPIEAHVLQTDGTIGAVLHIDPEDDPIVGQTATFFFEFKDRQGKFDANQCDCQAIITENGQQLLSQPISGLGQGPSLTSASFTYVFPQKDVYILKVTGSPTNGATFQPFTLTYNIRVARTSTSSGSQTNGKVASLIRYGILLAGILLLAGLITYDRIKSRQRATAKQDKQDDHPSGTTAASRTEYTKSPAQPKSHHKRKNTQKGTRS